MMEEKTKGMMRETRTKGVVYFKTSKPRVKKVKSSKMKKRTWAIRIL